MKYREYQPRPAKKSQELHPIWRGIGFVLMVIIPVLSYYISLALIAENGRRHWIPIPGEFIARGSDPLLYVKIGLTIAIAIVIFIIFQAVVFITNSMFGTPRYGPLDSPEIPGKRRRAR